MAGLEDAGTLAPEPAEGRAVVLCFLLRDGGRQVLLGRKKSGFGSGRTVGLGGKVEPGETLAQAICREVQEESGVVLAEADVDQRGVVDFRFPSHPHFDMHTAIFVASRWQGEPAESDELVPAWFDVGKLPVQEMWQDADHWLPRFLAGEKLHVTVTLADDNATVVKAEMVPWP